MTEPLDVVVIGAGILGLAHAWRAAIAGHRVVVLERGRKAQAASIRNFGMIWPIGQPTGELFQMAIRSRELWLEVGEQTGLWVNPCGSLHLAHQPDELAVIEEFVSSQTGSELAVKILTPEASQTQSHGINRQGLLAAMHSPYELCVNPRRMIQSIPGWLHEQHGVEFRFDTCVQEISEATCVAADQTAWRADRVVVCCGTDFKTLFPKEFAQSGLRTCKLQMLRTVPQPDGWQIGTHLASGLTLRHYASFHDCNSLQNLKDRIRNETPELDKYGIHVMASQDDEGHVILGDSHEYDHDITPFDSGEINQLILRELRKQFDFPTWEIDQTWHGFYVKHPEKTLVQLQPRPNVDIFCSPGGAGMTLSFGWADQFWQTV